MPALTKRSVATVVILTIVTCGIYGIYWYWVAIHELDAAGKSSNIDPTIQFILMFLPYVGSIMFGMNADANINSIKQQRGIPTEDNKVLWIVLFIIIPVVGIGLVQDSINKLA